MIDKLDQMGEELEENKETTKMKKIKVSSMAEAILSAKEKGLKEFMGVGYPMGLVCQKLFL